MPFDATGNCFSHDSPSASSTPRLGQTSKTATTWKTVPQRMPFMSYSLNGGVAGAFSEPYAPMHGADIAEPTAQPGARSLSRRWASSFLAISSAALTACSSWVIDDALHSPRSPEQLKLQCANWASVSRGPYRVENNTWGQGGLRGWRQCVGLGLNPDMSAMAYFTWDWPESGPSIKAYPAVIYGQKPTATSTARTLPQPVHAFKAMRVDYSVHATHNGAGNIAFDLWLTNTRNAASFRSPPITHELMIWLGHWGGVVPEGPRVETAAIGGMMYDDHVAHPHAGGGTYIAFNPHTPQVGPGSIDILLFLRHAQKQGYLQGTEYLASIELGSEIAFGRGELRIDHLDIQLQPE